MKYFSMFSGIGGFELGINNAFAVKGIKQQQDSSWTGKVAIPQCVGYSEIDKYAIQIYERHFKHTNFGDATTIVPNDLPNFDLLVGGFPCQSFSVAGKRKGFNDTRGTLFFDIARILSDKRPRHLLLENVKGLLTHDRGKTFQIILGVLADLGYRVEWQVLNSKEFGVPQNRERVFIVGHLRGECTKQVFPLRQADFRTAGQYDKGVQESEIAQTITATYWKGGKGSHITEREDSGQTKAKPNLDNPKRRPTYSIGSTQQNAGVMKEVSTALTEAMGEGGGHVPMVTRQPLRFLERNQKNIDGDYAFTVDSSQTSGVAVADKIRRLTPTECERLQGFPDGWTEGVSDTQRYKTLGNAVTTNVVKAVMEAMC